MSGFGAKRVCLAFCAIVVTLGVGAPVAQGAASDPLFVFSPTGSAALNGPCGLTVDSAGAFDLSDYYHHAVLKGSAAFSSGVWQVSTATQIASEDPLDGPCGLVRDSTNRLYVNNFHRNVVRFNASPPFGSGTVIAGANGANDPSARPTGVAVDALDNVYVNERTYVAEFDSVGNPVKQVGSGSLGDAYGLAVSQYPGTFGYLYVPDASTNTVKVYDPATSTTTPKAEIKDPFSKAFVSLKDSAIAVDRVTGDIYFADNTQPAYTEQPQAILYVYDSTNSYKGHLKYNVIDALPPGIAVDNSTQASQGRVYVTSGNTSPASLYAYGPGSGTFATPLPPIGSLAPSASGNDAQDSSGDAGQVTPAPVVAGVSAPSVVTTPSTNTAAALSSTTPAKRRHHRNVKHHQARRHHHRVRDRHGHRR